MSMAMILLSFRDVLYIWSGFYVYLMGSRNSQKNARFCAGQGDVENWLQSEMYRLCDYVALSTFLRLEKTAAGWPRSGWMILV